MGCSLELPQCSMFKIRNIMRYEFSLFSLNTVIFLLFDTAKFRIPDDRFSHNEADMKVEFEGVLITWC